MNLKSIKAKALALAASVMVIGGVGMVTASPALADTQDCFPAGCSGYYSSAGNGGSRVGYDAALSNGWAAGATIQWSSNAIYVSGPVKDVAADGQGAVAQIEICPGGNANCSIDTTHVTKGKGNYLIADAYRSGITVTDGSAVQIRSCNGFTAAGNPENCGAWHGWFHRY